jgi:hypothetical protein
MGKFKTIQTDVFSVFASTAWKNEKIKTIPSNIKAPAGPFIRVNIITDGRGVNNISVSGVLIVDIFTEAGKGPDPAIFIADKLDTYLVNKTLGTASQGVVQFFNSTYSPLDVKDTLSRGQYTIPLKYFRGQ